MIRTFTDHVIVTMRTALLSGSLLLGSLGIQAQEWHYLSPTNGNIPANAYGIAFSIGGMGYFGTGTTQAVSGGVVNGSIRRHDPTTNTVTLMPVGIYPARAQATAFVIGNYAYIGLGNDRNVTYFADFRKFDPALTYTTPIAPFPGGNRHGAIAFTIGNKAYVGGGLDTDTIFWNQNPSNDLWEYDPATDAWTAKAPMPAAFEAGVAFAVGGKGHVIADNGSALWQYDPVANSWTVKAPIPSGNLSERSAFVANGLAYVGCGGSTQAFHAYDVNTNTWSSAPALWAAAGRRNAAAYSIGNTGYLVGGISGSSIILNDLWDFGPVATAMPDTWTQRPFFPGAPREFPIAFSIGGTAYAGGGTTGSGAYLTDFQAYDPVARTWTPKAALPPNADLGFSIGTKGYVTTQSATQNFWEYDPATNTWTARADLPGGARSRAAAFSVEGKGHVMTGLIGGVRQSDHWIYNPVSNTWSPGATVPGLPKHLASGYAIGNRGYLAGGNTGGSSTADGSQYCYDPATDQWVSSSSIPLGGRQAAQAFSVGNIGYYGGGFGGGPAFRKMFHAYDPTTNSWTQLADLGGNYRYNGIGFSIGAKGYVFAGSVNPSSSSSVSGGFERSNSLWEFAPSTVSVSPRALLEGPFIQGQGLMSDALRANGMLPLTDPYATTYPLPGGAYSDLGSGQIPATTGNDAVVDRVIVELRDASTPSVIKASRSVWLQRDGDAVDMDGISPVRFTLSPGAYHMALRHRNHLGVMTAAPVALTGTATTVDLTSNATATYGTEARKTVGSKLLLWAGDANFNRTLSYTGANNDRDPILVRIGSSTPSTVINGYYSEDINMDGVVKYVGSANDRDPILTNIGSTTPNAVRQAQLP